MKGNTVAGATASLAGLALHFAPLATDAATIQLTVRGVVRTVAQDTTPDSAQLLSSVKPGDSFEAIVEFDPEAKEAFGAGDPTFAEYDGTISSARVIVAGSEYVLPVTPGAPSGHGGSAIIIHNDTPPTPPGFLFSDAIWFQTLNVLTAPAPPETRQMLSIYLISLTKAPSPILSSDALSQYSQAPLFAGSKHNWVNFGTTNSNGGFGVVADVDRVLVAVAPPATE